MSCKNAICVLEAGHGGVCAATFLEARMMKDLARAHARIMEREQTILDLVEERDEARDERQKLVDDVDEARRVAIEAEKGRDLAAEQRDVLGGELAEARAALDVKTTMLDAAIEERGRLRAQLDAANETNTRWSRIHMEAAAERDRLRAVLADTPDPTLLSKLRGIITDALDEPGSWDNVVHALLAALCARAGVERVSCSEAHPQQDVFHPGGHVRVAEDQTLSEGELARVRESLRGVKEP